MHRWRGDGGGLRIPGAHLLLLAEQEGWLDEQHEVPSEQQLQEVYHEQRSGEEGRRHPLDSHREQIEGWREEGYSFLVIHNNLKAAIIVASFEDPLVNRAYRELVLKPSFSIFQRARAARTSWAMLSVVGTRLVTQAFR